MMEHVTSTTSISGRLSTVFDLVTTARFWPQWHPVTVRVSGVTERPYQLGDVVHEFVAISGVQAELFWVVAEHVRPSRIVLTSDAPTMTITYSFGRQGEAVQFTRELDYDPDYFARAISIGAAALHRLVQAQSDDALGQLRRLVENIVADEDAAVHAKSGGR
jgi:Polyketide cyclase / dehydrase and lipid transport